MQRYMQLEGFLVICSIIWTGVVICSDGYIQCYMHQSSLLNTAVVIYSEKKLIFRYIQYFDRLYAAL